MASPTLPAPAPPTALGAFTETGLTGLQRFAGYVREEFHKDLQGDKALRAYDEMANNSPVVGACLFTVEMLARQARWKFEPFDDSQAALDTAEFVESCRDDMSTGWNDTLGEILSLCPFGFSYHEIVYKRRNGFTGPGPTSKHDDGLIGWRKLPIRAQRSRSRWEFDPEGGIKGMYQMPAPDYRERFIPIEKALLFRPGVHKGNPEGRSLLRRAYRPWYFAKRLEEIEAIGCERDLAGLPVFEIPAEMCNANASPEQKAAYEVFKKMAVSLKRDEQEGLVLPQSFDSNGNKLYEFRLQATGGTRRVETDPVIQRYNAQIAMCFMADFLMLGHEKVGSFALASSKTSLFATALGALLDNICDVFNRHAVPRLLLLNGMDVEVAPKLTHGDLETPDLPEVADYISKLASAGMPIFPDRLVENRLRNYASLPELSEEDFDERQAVLDEQAEAERQAALDLKATAPEKPAPVQKQEEPDVLDLFAAVEQRRQADRARHDAEVAELRKRADEANAALLAALSRPVEVLTGDVHVAAPSVTVQPQPVVVEAPVVNLPPMQVTVEAAKPQPAPVAKKRRAKVIPMADGSFEIKDQ